MTVAEWVVLREMYETEDDVTSPWVIAEVTGLTRGAISKLISRLLDKGLVTRNESNDDRRYQEIQLTQKGADLIPRLAKLADENDENFFSVLDKSERKFLKEILTKMAEHHQLKTKPIE